jgi:hypothetical protein
MNGILFLFSWLVGTLAVRVGIPIVSGRARIGAIGRTLSSAVLAYLLLLALFGAFEWYLEFKLNAFDLNKDGVFDFSESTPAQQELFDRLVNDSGRNLLRVFGFPVLLLFAACTEACLTLVRALRKRENSGSLPL